MRLDKAISKIRDLGWRLSRRSVGWFDWQRAEARLEEMKRTHELPKCLPTNVREWVELARQVELVNKGDGLALADVHLED